MNMIDVWMPAFILTYSVPEWGNITKFVMVLNDKVFWSIKDLCAMDNSLQPNSGTSMTSAMSGEPDRWSSVSHFVLRQGDHPHLCLWQAELTSAVLIPEARLEHLDDWLPPRAIQETKGDCMP